jgi:hypothetical protein
MIILYKYLYKLNPQGVVIQLYKPNPQGVAGNFAPSTFATALRNRQGRCKRLTGLKLCKQPNSAENGKNECCVAHLMCSRVDTKV